MSDSKTTVSNLRAAQTMRLIVLGRDAEVLGDQPSGGAARATPCTSAFAAYAFTSFAPKEVPGLGFTFLFQSRQLSIGTPSLVVFRLYIMRRA